MKAISIGRRGFMLVEVLFVLGLLAFVALVGGQIFLTLNQTTQKVAQHQTAEMRFDQAVVRLRQDVWDASQCMLADSHTLNIKLADKTVTWKAAQSLRREAGDNDVQTWDELQTDLTFQARGPTVVVVQEPVAGETGGRVALLNEATLLKGAAR